MCDFELYLLLFWILNCNYSTMGKTGYNSKLMLDCDGSEIFEVKITMVMTTTLSQMGNIFFIQ